MNPLALGDLWTSNGFSPPEEFFEGEWFFKDQASGLGTFIAVTSNEPISGIFSFDAEVGNFSDDVIIEFTNTDTSSAIKTITLTGNGTTSHQFEVTSSVNITMSLRTPNGDSTEYTGFSTTTFFVTEPEATAFWTRKQKTKELPL